MSNAVQIFKRREKYVEDPDSLKNDMFDVVVLCLKNILKFPEVSTVQILEGNKTTVVEIDVTQEDFGRLLGSRGKTIGSLRTIISAMAASKGVRAIIEIKDEDRFYP